MVKVGDRVRVLMDGADHAHVQRGDEFVVYKVFNEGALEVEGEYHWVFNSDSYEVIHATPPQKITQNGYEYELVGPVKPEWLVDGAWVVDKESGRKYRVSCDNGVYTFNNGTREVIIDFISLPTRFRPHAASDWKWGDWAMYAGRKVFVIEKGNWKGDIRVSHPDLHDGVACVPVLQLTPTF